MINLLTDKMAELTTFAAMFDYSRSIFTADFGSFTGEPKSGDIGALGGVVSPPIIISLLVEPSLWQYLTELTFVFQFIY